ALDLRAALQTGDVLGALTNDNLRAQLLRGGAPSGFVGALESSEALARYLWAEITVPWEGAEPLPFKDEFAARFSWTLVDKLTVRFTCRGLARDVDFRAAGLPQAQGVHESLLARYELIRDIVLSQIAHAPPQDENGTPITGLNYTFQSPPKFKK